MKEIPLTQNKVALVDDEDFESLSAYIWHAHKAPKSPTYYAARNDGSGFFYMHREIMNAAPGVKVDHKNGNGLDNQKSNLRFCTHHQNMMNRAAHSTANKTSRFKGVYRIKSRPGWFAAIKFNRKTVNLGYFKTEEDAARSYDAKARELFGEFARPNFPGMEGE